ncbi:hypothetical protein N072000002_18290 [Clostridium tetani]|uniref:Uncharacterized protein n=1 Tax=Clostridium tetani TaxID=1513 RepID=A0ABC8EEE3_CLOTA|nr:hypothetical protein [Clostridium tetani]BDR81646.1 hypothetical protein K234311028_18920 [Clostridium tetani]BDR90028.1 hypothetical protein N072000002_18290 [Clostridium tetani]
MEITIKDTNLVDKELEKKIHKELKGKEKMYALLSYRIDVVRNIVEEYGMRLGNYGIKGMPFNEGTFQSEAVIKVYGREDIELKIMKLP